MKRMSPNILDEIPMMEKGTCKIWLIDWLDGVLRRIGNISAL